MQRFRADQATQPTSVPAPEQPNLTTFTASQLKISCDRSVRQLHSDTGGSSPGRFNHEVNVQHGRHVGDHSRAHASRT